VKLIGVFLAGHTLVVYVWLSAFFCLNLTDDNFGIWDKPSRYRAGPGFERTHWGLAYPLTGPSRLSIFEVIVVEALGVVVGTAMAVIVAKRR
jgi:hypothetical protein